MVPKSMDIASQIRATRARLCLTQQEAAAAWRVNLRTLQDWEQGRRFPRGEEMLRLMPILFPAGAPSGPAPKTGLRT